MQPTQKNYIVPAIIVVIILIIAGVIISSKNGRTTDTVTSTSTPVSQTPKLDAGTTTIRTAEYVTLVSSNLHEAVFQFQVPITSADVTMANIRPCIADASAVGTASTTIPCQPPNKFKVSFDVVTNRVTISELTINAKDKDTWGIFRTGCASCEHVVNFTNIHDKAGVTLPTKLLFVY